MLKRDELANPNSCLNKARNDEYLFVLLGRDKSAVVAVAAWINHRIQVIRRRTKFELDKAEARAHILEGLLRALDILDEVIALIKAAPTPAAAATSTINTATG